ncbi:acyltransferase 3 [Xylariomycetidae sp. FL0641]|nr:acyltransferase 3 [Xylariomycetidae sp. FL0641]
MPRIPRLPFRQSGALLPLSIPRFTSDKDDANNASPQLRPTSYLDGLRGIAALIVCVCHYTENNFRSLTPWFGIPTNVGLSQAVPQISFAPPMRSWSLIQLPFVRVIFSGRPMVHIFFVISGFALSVGPLRAVRARDPVRFHSTLASSAFRRPIRLCGPPVVSTFMVMVMCHWGWVYLALPTWYLQIADWMRAVYYHIIWPWNWEQHLWPPYDVHMWTIPIELCHSMLLFLLLLLLSRVRVRVRVGCALAFMVYSLHCGKWAAFEFVAGSVLAEMHLAALEQGPPEPLDVVAVWRNRDDTSRASIRRQRELAIHGAIVLAFFFIAGWPNAAQWRTPIIGTLARLAPASFPPRDPEGPQSSGRISFAVYIVHGPVLDILQTYVLGRPTDKYRWRNAAGKGLRGLFGVDTPLGRTACWAGGILILFPIVLVAAHFFCAYIDEPIVRFAKRVETWCLADPPGGAGGSGDRGRQRDEDRRRLH